MSTHILRIDEFQTALEIENAPEVQPLNEGLFGGSKTKNKLTQMLAPTISTGKDIFKSINENVNDLENIINKYNETLKDSETKSISHKVEDVLTVTFDKALLNVQSLIDIADLKFGSFTKDVLMCNIVNFKVFVSPIRMAQIMALGYRYYMAIIRQALQSALITIELYADTFFTMVRDDINGNEAKFSEYFTRMRDVAMQQLEAAIEGTDEDTSKRLKVDEKSRKATLEVLKQFKTIGSEYSKMNRDIGYGGYRQNIFQEGGRNIETLLRDNGGKELQSIQERFTQLGNKPSKDGDDNMVASYASAVKTNAEVRAYNLCTKINMNMMKIVKMFSLRSQEGLSALVAELDAQAQTSIEKEQKSIEERMKEVREATIIEYNNAAFIKTKEARAKEKEKLDAMGFNKLDKKAYSELLESDGKISYVKFLTEQGFTEMQAADILEENSVVDDYKTSRDSSNDIYWLPKRYSGRRRSNDKCSPIELPEKYDEILHFNKNTRMYDCDEDLKVDKDLVENGRFIISFGTIKGDFNCSSIDLVSLENAPIKVFGSYNCTGNDRIVIDEDNFYGYLPKILTGKLVADKDCDTELAKHYYNSAGADDENE